MVLTKDKHTRLAVCNRQDVGRDTQPVNNETNLVLECPTGDYKLNRVVDVLPVTCSGPRLDESSQHQPMAFSLLDHLTNGWLALSSYEALLLALHQLLQVTPHLHLLHVGGVALPHHLLLLT